MLSIASSKQLFINFDHHPNSKLVFGRKIENSQGKVKQQKSLLNSSNNLIKNKEPRKLTKRKEKERKRQILNKENEIWYSSEKKKKKTWLT